MRSLHQDLRDGLRTLARRPGFALAAALSLALGIGAQTSVYSLIRVLFLPPPAGVTDPDRLVGISALSNGKPDEDAIRYPDYLYYRDHNAVFSELASHFNSGAALVDSERAEELDVYVVSANYFSVLGIKPVAGRFFVSDEDLVSGKHPVVILSHAFWQRRFDGDADCIGQAIALNETRFTILGVAPPGFEGTKVGWPVDVFIPNMMAGVARGLDFSSRDSATLDLLGRLREGRTLEQARAEMTVLARQLEDAYPDTNRGSGIYLSPLTGIHPEARPAATALSRLLAISVAFLLVITCANLSGLLLAQNAVRQREIAIRCALGAGRARIIRQLLIESLLLSLVGGLAGLLIASWSNALLATSYSVEIEGVQHLYAVDLDWSAFIVSLLLAIVAGFAFGFAPALQASRAALVPALRKDALARGFRHSRLRAAFLVAQVALSIILMIGAGLVVQSARTLRRDPGFNTDNVLYLRMRPRLSGYDQEKTERYFRDVKRRLEALPEVESLAFLRFPPTLWPGTIAVSLPERESTRPEDALRVLHNGPVTPGYFDVSRIPFVRGRGFEERDLGAGREAVVINHVLAERLWRGGDPIGETLLVDGKPSEVIGVVQYAGLRAGGDVQRPFLFRTDWRSAAASGRMVIRTKSDPVAILPSIRREILAVDPRVAISEAMPLTRLVQNMFAEVPLAMGVLSFAGSLALVLAAIGLYGVLSLAARQRTREIGVRMALGARALRILNLVLREGMALVVLGLALGLGSAVLMSRLLTRFLYGIAPNDPLTYVAATLLLGGVALAACAVPAWRAARVDPMVALRCE